jgi:hypothetical protein
VKKDAELPRHKELPIRNLEVMKTMQSLESRGYVKSQFSWQYYYYVLNDSGAFMARLLVLVRNFRPSLLYWPAQIVTSVCYNFRH